jgi:TPR repeat protein
MAFQKGGAVRRRVRRAYRRGDYPTAADLFRPLAEQGDAKVQNYLGVMHDVLQDHVQAASWYRKAAQQGHGGDQINLGLCYVGAGVSQDYVLAHRW